MISNKDNLLNTLRGSESLRTPWVPFIGVHGGKILGVSSSEYLKSAKLMTDGVLKAAELYKADGIPICFDLQIEAEMLGCKLKWEEKTPPAVVSHPLAEGKSISDLPNFSANSGRLALALEALKNVKEKIGDTTALYALITGPFTLALHLRGNNIFLDMFDDEDEMKKLMDYCCHIQMQVAKAYLDTGADVLAIVDPMASQISPEHFEVFVKPYVNKIFDLVHSYNKIGSMFVCGNATRNLEQLCSCSCENVSVDENVDLTLLRELALKHGKSFGGNIRLTVVILLGDEIDSAKDALRCLEQGGKKNYILSPGCDLPYDSPIANLEAVRDVVLDEYKRKVAGTLFKNPPNDSFDDIKLPDYSKERVIDVVTLDSAGCPPCLYMLRAAQEAAAQVDANIKVCERKITGREGLGFMTKLKVTAIPTICIDGKPTFASIIPDKNTLIEAIKK